MSLLCKLTVKLMFEHVMQAELVKTSFLYQIDYGVDSVSRIDKIIGLFCKRALKKRRYSAKETFNSIDPTDRSHPMSNHYGADVFRMCFFVKEFACEISVLLTVEHVMQFVLYIMEMCRV